jgi:hypothetical protein
MRDSPAVASFLEKYDAGIAAQIRAVRKHLAYLFPRGFIEQAEPALAVAPPLTTVVKSVSSKQRPRKPSAPNAR